MTPTSDYYPLFPTPFQGISCCSQQDPSRLATIVRGVAPSRARHRQALPAPGSAAVLASVHGCPPSSHPLPPGISDRLVVGGPTDGDAQAVPMDEPNSVSPTSRHHHHRHTSPPPHQPLNHIKFNLHVCMALP